MIVLGAATSAYAVLLGPALNFIFQRGETGSFGQQFSRFVPGFDMQAWLKQADPHQILAVLPFLIVGVTLLKGVAFYGQAYLMASVSSGMIADLRCALFNRL